MYWCCNGRNVLNGKQHAKFVDKGQKPEHIKVSHTHSLKLHACVLLTIELWHLRRFIYISYYYCCCCRLLQLHTHTHKTEKGVGRNQKFWLFINKCRRTNVRLCNHSDVYEHLSIRKACKRKVWKKINKNNRFQILLPRNHFVWSYF